MAAIWSAGAECRTWFLSVGGSGDLSPKPRQAFDRNRYVTRIETRVYPKLEHTGTPCDRFHPGPYTSSVFRATARQARSRSTPSTSAITRIVTGTRYGAFGRPRNGSGARYGAGPRHLGIAGEAVGDGAFRRTHLLEDREHLGVRVAVVDLQGAVVREY